MSNMLKDNRLPIVISAAALLVATLIGLVPIMQSGSRDVAASAAPDMSAFEDRLAALESGAGGADEAAAPAIPANADNARLRQEIDLINRGLANQTGRVSRLKNVVEGVVGPNGQVIPAAIVTDEIALAKRGLVNLTRRINALEDRMDALDTAAADITRLQQQMENVDRAFARLARNANEAKTERASLAAQLAGQPGATPASADTGDISAIESKLDAILEQLQN